SKFLVQFSRLFNLLLVTGPLLAIPVLAGGVGLADVAISFWQFLVFGILGLLSGMLTSTRSRRFTSAMVAALCASLILYFIALICFGFVPLAAWSGQRFYITHSAFIGLELCLAGQQGLWSGQSSQILAMWLTTEVIFLLLATYMALK